MKAWCVFTDYSDVRTIVFAETAGKARYLAQSTDVCEDADWRDIRVKRMPRLDGMEASEPRDNRWLNEEVRLILVKEYGWSCLEPDYDECKECVARQYCNKYE